MSNGFFDEDVVPESWFNESASPEGWFADSVLEELEPPEPKQAVAKSFVMYSRGAGVRSKPDEADYATLFNTDEDPLSDGGTWVQNNVWFKKLFASGGVAYGNQANPKNPGVYEDAYGLVDVGSVYQYAQCRLHKGTTGGNMEVELWLCASDNANSTSAVECGIDLDGDYGFINAWGGTPLSGPATSAYFTNLFDDGDGLAVTPTEGMLFKAWREFGTTIVTMALGGTDNTMDGTVIGTADLATGGRTPESGTHVGLGFYVGSAGGETANSNVGANEFRGRRLEA